MIEPFKLDGVIKGWIGGLDLWRTGLLIFFAGLAFVWLLKWAASARLSIFSDSVALRDYNYSVSLRGFCATGLDSIPIVTEIRELNENSGEWGSDLLSNIHMQLPRNTNLDERWQPNGATSAIINIGHIEPPDGGSLWRFFFDFNNPPPSIRSKLGDPDTQSNQGLNPGIYRLTLEIPKTGQKFKLRMAWSGEDRGIVLSKMNWWNR